jgi:flagellar FliL protein
MAEKEQASAAEQGKSGGGKKLLVIVGLILAIAGGGAGAYFYLGQGQSAGKDKHAAVEVVEEAGPPIVVPLEIFTANLQPADSEKYLQIGLALTFSGGGGGNEGGGDALKPYLPVIRDAVVAQMAELTPEDVTGNAARERLRTSIKSAIEKKLPAPERKTFKDVLFTQFVVQ